MASIPPKDVMLANARALRRAMTPWERKLWYRFLRTYPVKFYKQQIIGPYIADFCCPSARLIVELDGSRHFTPDEQPADAKRSAALQAHGYAVLRFPNVDIDRRFRAPCEAIDLAVKRRIQ